MSWLVRKISRAKWPQDGCLLENYPGDAISELNTTKNALSFWMIDNLDDLNKVVVALATVPKVQYFADIDIIWVKLDELSLLDFDIDDSIDPNIIYTAADKYTNMHRNVCNFTYSTIRKMAEMVLKMINENNFKRVRSKIVKNYTKEVYISGCINLDLCNPALAERIKVL